MAKPKDDIIDEARKRLELCIDACDGDRAEALEDLKFRKGDQWDEQSVRQRELDGRPCLTINNIPAIVHQVTNDIRQNRQSIAVHPTNGGACVEVAEVIEGVIRHIEYDSGADAAYDTALDTAVSCGFGFFRLVTEYEGPKSFDLVMKIKRVRNPFTVYLDPASEEADGSDSKYGFVTTKIAKDEFLRTYPKKDPTIDYIAKGAGDDENWLGDDFVRVCEYYRIEEQTETLVQLSNGQTQFATDKRPLPEGVYPVATRQTTTQKVMLYKLTAKEVLESAEVPFDWIPIFPVYGEEMDIDGKVVRNGLVRHAKDPAKAYNYWITAATEEIALRTKTPFIGALGQFENLEEDWANANTRSFSYLEYNPITIEGNLAPAPMRQPPADVPQGYIAMAGLARDNVKAVTGIYDASLGNRSNETSGIAIRARQHQGDVGNFHFADNFTRAIRHMGRTILSGVPRVYDTQRILRVMGVDGQAKQVEVNKPMGPGDQPEQDEITGAVRTVMNDLTVGTYDVVVSSGPAYNTLRQEAADSMVQMAGSWPKLMEVAGDKVVRAMDWPGADDIADRIAKTLPPGLADDDGKKQPDMVQTPNGPIPSQQAGQLIGQMDHTLQQMQAELEQHEAGLKKVQMEVDGRIEVARIQAEAKQDEAELRGAIDLIKQQLDPVLAHHAAVMAAADDAHPDAPAGIQQGMEQSPVDAQQNAMQQQQAVQSPDAAQAPEPAPKPKRKVIKITAPSGNVYHGEIGDAPDEEEPAQ